MKKRLSIILLAIRFFFDHITASPASRRWDWENRGCPNNRAKWKRKNRDMARIDHERFLKATGRI